MKTLQHYIDGRFVAPVTGAGRFSVIPLSLRHCMSLDLSVKPLKKRPS